MSVAPVSLGFLLPDPARLSASPPVVTYGHGQAVLDGFARDWDYNASVPVEWHITVNVPGVLADCDLGDGAGLDAVVSWHSTWTNLRGAGSIVPVFDGENTLGVEIPGEVLGGTLNLTVTVTLSKVGIGAARFAPRRPGSPLWSSRAAVVLEGVGARMPVMAVDFAATGRGRGQGLWLLECDRDLTTSVTGALLLYLNAVHPDMQSLLDRPTGSDAAKLAQFITYDVTRQLILRALRHEELDDRHHYEQGTLGDLFLTLLQTYLPSRSLDQLRSQFEDDPGEIEAELLSRAWSKVE